MIWSRIEVLPDNATDGNLASQTSWISLDEHIILVNDHFPINGLHNRLPNKLLILVANARTLAFAFAFPFMTPWLPINGVYLRLARFPRLFDGKTIGGKYIIMIYSSVIPREVGVAPKIFLARLSAVANGDDNRFYLICRIRETPPRRGWNARFSHANVCLSLITHVPIPEQFVSFCR